MTSTRIAAPLWMSIAICMLNLLTGCSTIGRTEVLSIEVKPPLQFQFGLGLGTVVLEENATRVDAVGVFPMGEFSKDDLQKVRTSLENALRSMQRDISPVPGKRSTAHVMVRRYLITSSNSAIGALANISWCIADDSGNILYQEQFYASYSQALFVTLGDVKNKVNEAALLRIVSMAAYLADAHKTSLPPMPPNAYQEFEQAVEQMPNAFQSIHVTYFGNIPLPYDVRNSADWKWVKRSGRINWEARIRDMQ